MIKQPYRPTSEVLRELIITTTTPTVTVAEINHKLHERGFGILLAICSLPLVLPIPMPPGYTTLFSIPLFILCLQMIWGADRPWLPKWLLKKRVSVAKLQTLVDKSVPMLQRIEKLLRARLMPFQLSTIERIIGICTFIYCCSIAIPLPMTNVPPAIGILFMALGLLARDGLMIILGNIIGIIGWVLTLTVLFFGVQILEKVF